ncbi:N-acetylmuramic acid 6-phosphate etherase [Terriglobus roseus DSM 18391]|uniref:N-acetylmuramic acid 6-phosphate etherase n=1 Tax=Terriglobus roseus (strain DSM 18391 / NRRL B-41598 / KBS 63) TaxID=926566 RepID=I3ZBZ4_TERRK|nr:N-acetylmuramic acid 6-phosphate etherase [Terriglobus roseus]AFL86762.1 N-acetylmuramic acid 6-phosphate etherase [Terriglobus roseus DSM 18391]
MQLANLLTETRNPASEQIDTLPTEQMLRVFNDEDATVAARVAEQIPQIAKAVDAIYERVQKGGRLFYMGAGTSGRLGVLDASECPPTYGVPRDLVVGIMAGGDPALRVSSEGAEDSREQGAIDLLANGFNQSPGQDVLVGIAASGRTPYVLGAMEMAKQHGCLTVGLSCVPGSPVATASDIAITPATGAEVITGSTRMKAGTATKLALNMLSTGLMVKLGHVYGNLMTNVQTSNVKLVDRAERIIAAATGASAEQAASLLQQAGNVRTAIVMQKLGMTREAAEARLAAANQNLRKALGE